MILCCGEALIDFVPRPDLGAYQPCPGGSVYNVAVGLGRLEIPVGLYCKISTDFFGDMLVDYLEDNNVDTSTCQRTQHPTTLAFVSLATRDHAEPQFSFYANGSADRSLTVDELPPQLPDEIKVLHFGSISLVMEPGAMALEPLMARERGRPATTMVREAIEEWVVRTERMRISEEIAAYAAAEAGGPHDLDVDLERAAAEVFFREDEE